LHSLGPVTTTLLYVLGVVGEAMLLSAIYLVMPVGRLSVRHAFLGGVVATILWELTRHALGWYYATVSQIQVVYGTLATSVGVLLSAEFGAIVLLAGAQVIAEYERELRLSKSFFRGRAFEDRKRPRDDAPRDNPDGEVLQQR